MPTHLAIRGRSHNHFGLRVRDRVRYFAVEDLATHRPISPLSLASNCVHPNQPVARGDGAAFESPYADGMNSPLLVVDHRLKGDTHPSERYAAGTRGTWLL